MSPKEAAAELVRKLGRSAKGLRPMTVADASVASGLPLRDAEAGLHWLTSEHRGHLRVTEDGDLVHVFPHGFEKPWETREALARLAARVGAGLLAAGRFVVRVWLLAVMIGYAALFVALLVGLTLARQGDDRDDGRSGLGLLGGLLRMIGDALFWTLHPFSPIYVGAYDGGWGAAPARPSWRRDQPAAPKIPFYEKVNRFVFGPPTVEEDPNVVQSKILAQIRARKGRIGVADVLAVTGKPRAEVDAMMARLMLDFDGEVDVAENGGIVYRFPGLRRTADDHPDVAPAPAWTRRKELPPLTGNGIGANVAIALLNGFNLTMAAVLSSIGLTLSNVTLLFSKHPPVVLPADGIAWALGIVPLVFSLGIFVLPLLRAAVRSFTARRIARENGRQAMLGAILERATQKREVPESALRTAYRVATGVEPSSREITANVVDLGGDVVIDGEGTSTSAEAIRYRFPGLEDDEAALEEERAAAPAAEAKLGRVVFGSDR